MQLCQVTLDLLNAERSYQAVYDSLEQLVLDAKRKGVTQRSVYKSIAHAAQKYDESDHYDAANSANYDAAFEILDRVWGWGRSEDVFWETSLSARPPGE